jgi:DNA-binding transcriptional ArsR family regulator
VISDASAVRALAHPARLAVIDALYAGRTLTATECAAIAGITPSAMSYHLRALEKYGVIRRAEGRGDARQRPWERAGDTLSFNPHHDESSEAGLGALGVLMENSLHADRERLLAAAREDAVLGPDSTWTRTTTYARDPLVLTPDEARELRQTWETLLEPFEARRRQSAPPEGAAPFTISIILARDVDRTRPD